ATWLRPLLASAVLPFDEMGRLAVQILLDSDYGGPREVRLPMTLRPGGSLPTPVRQARGERRGGVGVDTTPSVTDVTSRRIVRHVPAGEGSTSTWPQ
ncbi:MAG: hypothetical protein ABIQ15_02785, partial [Nocardioides sp.]